MKVYDKVSLFFPSTEMDDSYKVEKYLYEGRIKIDAQTGEYESCSGTVLGMAVKQSKTGISVTGSFPKLLYGNNYIPMRRKDAKEVVDRISNALGVDMGRAFVVGLEFGATFPMLKPPREYMQLLGKLPYYERVEMNGKAASLYYKQKGQGREVCFYDKIAEITQKGGAIPLLLDNLLRYELRFRRHIGQKLGVRKVTASKLSQVQFYDKLKNEYLNTYMAIKKQNTGKGEDLLLTADTPKKCLDAIISEYLNLGGAQKISEIMNKIKHKGRLEYKAAARLEKKLYDLYRNVGGIESKDILELEEAVKDAVYNG